MLQVGTRNNRRFATLVEIAVRLELFVLQVDPAVSLRITRASEFPAVSLRKHPDSGEQLLQSCSHDERIKACLAATSKSIRNGWQRCHLLVSPRIGNGCISVHFCALFHRNEGLRTGPS
jgi:hypothetical protein